MKWKDDCRAEKRMKEQFQLSWKIEQVPLGKIDWKRSRNNHARLLAPIDEQVVVDYALAMENGAEFERPVVWEDKGSYVILGGNHRGLAYRLLVGEDDSKKLEAYVIKTDSAFVIEMLPRVLNLDHGMRMPKEEAIESAIHAIKSFSLDPETAAKMFNLKPKALADKIRARKVADRIGELGIKQSAFPQSTLMKLNKFEDNDNLLGGCARVILSYKLTTEQASDLLDTVSAERTESARLQKIDEINKQLALKIPQKPVPHKQNVKTKFLHALRRIENLLETYQTLEQLQILTKAEQDDVKGRFKKLAERLVSITSVKAGRNGRSSGRGMALHR